MKLFGGKKGGVHNTDTVYEAASDELLEAAEAEQPVIEDALLAELTEDPMFMELPPVDDAAAEEEPTDTRQEDGLMSSIAETLGLSTEELGEAARNAASAEAEAEDKKLSRKEKKAAKKAEKKAAKAAK